MSRSILTDPSRLFQQRPTYQPRPVRCHPDVPPGAFIDHSCPHTNISAKNADANLRRFSPFPPNRCTFAPRTAVRKKNGAAAGSNAKSVVEPAFCLKAVDFILPTTAARVIKRRPRRNRHRLLRLTTNPKPLPKRKANPGRRPRPKSDHVSE